MNPTDEVDVDYLRSNSWSWAFGEGGGCAMLSGEKSGMASNETSGDDEIRLLKGAFELLSSASMMLVNNFFSTRPTPFENIYRQRASSHGCRP